AGQRISPTSYRAGTDCTHLDPRNPGELIRCLCQLEVDAAPESGRHRTRAKHVATHPAAAAKTSLDGHLKAGQVAIAGGDLRETGGEPRAESAARAPQPHRNEKYSLEGPRNMQVHQQATGRVEEQQLRPGSSTAPVGEA